MKPGWVYLMANHRRGRTYLGVTSNLVQRAWQHRAGVTEGYTKEHGCKMLVWCERFENLQDARAQELRMKKWKRDWKVALIEKANPLWDDLFPGLNG
jgi:putative endonuclease